ncbi:DUF262 domain-containing protein [Cellulosimicrobium cellulans]|uniref:DUF262 domain-containing protein n=1 Tax=Cellulosimicrobium cellulans TaxID=1710 RepID=UPI0025B78148|nr:DUF262 domain-containing protein [Cellulosimicrobium cellulans]
MPAVPQGARAAAWRSTVEAHPRPLKSVFRSDVRLTVPLFQRQYVWNVADQWLPLWQDVQQTQRRFELGDLTPHFLGAVVLQQKPASLGSLDLREIIDGQQRLTTLQLFITAVRDLAEHRYGDTRLARRLTRLVENDQDFVERPDEEFKLWPTNRDRSAFRSVLSGDHVETPYAQSLSRPVQAYTWFRDHVAEHLDRTGRTPGEALARLADVITDGLVMVVIDLTADDDAQVIFETLNARGTPLLAADLIKNHIFRTLESAGRPVEDLYATYWRPLEERVWDEDVRQGRLVRKRLDVFMNYVLTAHLQQEVLSHDLFSTVRTYVGGDAGRAVELLDVIRAYSSIYLETEATVIGTAQEQLALRRLRIADTTTATPLLLWLFKNTGGAERERAIAVIESFIVRRAICGWSSSNYNRIFLEALRRVSSGERPVDAVIQEHLAGLGSGSGYWPRDHDLEQELPTRTLFKRLKREQLRLLLEALEDALTTRYTEARPPGTKLSVEHLLPQAWRSSWPLPDEQGDDAVRTVSERRDGLLHTLGNLTLVTGPLNSSMSNGSWAAKRQHLMRYSALTLNRTLPVVWDVEEIEERGRTLTRAACEIWPAPPPISDTVTPDLATTERASADELAIAGVDPSESARPVRTGRGDIAAHIDFAFADRAPGDFLTIHEISKVPSPAYPDKAPSQGAIAARLFPDGRPSTVPGVRPDRRDGVRGAVKV